MKKKNTEQTLPTYPLGTVVLQADNFKMRSAALIACYLIFITSLTVAQNLIKPTDKQIAALKANADSLIVGDINRSLDYIYPPCLEMVGGKHKVLQVMLQQRAKMKELNMVVKTGLDSLGDVVRSEKDLYCFVREKFEVSNKGNITTGYSYLLAYSHDDGLSWQFADTAGLRSIDPKKIYPTYPTTLIMPITIN